VDSFGLDSIVLTAGNIATKMGLTLIITIIIIIISETV
jgi:hypothetical protein